MIRLIPRPSAIAALDASPINGGPFTVRVLIPITAAGLKSLIFLLVWIVIICIKSCPEHAF